MNHSAQAFVANGDDRRIDRAANRIENAVDLFIQAVGADFGGNGCLVEAGVDALPRVRLSGGAAPLCPRTTRPER